MSTCRLLAGIGFLSLVSACTPHRDNSVVITVDLPSVDGVETGTGVRFRGTAIGRVQSITPLRDGARLQLLIDRPDAPVRLADRVAISPVGALGDFAVDIIPGPDSAAPIGRRASLLPALPDSAALVRQLITRAVVKEMVDRFRRADTNRVK